MRAEKNGFVCHLEGTWCEISNKYGVLEHGDIVEPEGGIPEGYAETLLDDFIDRHSVHACAYPLCPADRSEAGASLYPYIRLLSPLSKPRPCLCPFYIINTICLKTILRTELDPAL